jgi:hypothetical protein
VLTCLQYQHVENRQTIGAVLMGRDPRGAGVGIGPIEWQSALGDGTVTKSIRYAAKLLFQFRVVVDGKSGVMRTCEERIINFMSSSPAEAMRHASKAGTEAEFSYLNDEKNRVKFEFVGILDIMDLSPSDERETVFYSIRTMRTPMERKSKLLPSRTKLLKSIS